MRPAHGATARPGPVRPGSGYGRPLRQRPPVSVEEGSTDPAWWFERELELELEQLEIDALDGDRSAEPA